MLSVICGITDIFSWFFSFSQSRQIVNFTYFSCKKHGNWKVFTTKLYGCIEDLYTNFPHNNNPPPKKKTKTQKRTAKNLRTKQQQQKSLPHKMSFNRSKLWALVKGVPCAECSCLWKMAVLWWAVSLLKVFVSQGC